MQGDGMQTVGLVGVGRIGLPIAENLIKSGYRVLGYRRGSLTEFEQIGGIAARSPADVGAQTDIVLTCLPSAEALDEVVQGKDGLVQYAGFWRNPVFRITHQPILGRHALPPRNGGYSTIELANWQGSRLRV
jgi:NAD binding domain of 6-phosphogluconate dehydrogenase